MLLIKDVLITGETPVIRDILIDSGKIISVSKNIALSDGVTVLDAAGLVAAPGLVDMHVHFRDPGYEYKEDIITGAEAAAAGGVTTCACMPNTSPVVDSAEVVQCIESKVKNACVKVLPYGAVTVGQNGLELTDFKALKAAGAVALSDDGNPIKSAAVARRAMQLAKECDMLISSHCEDAEMVENYAVNEGGVSTKLGLPGRPPIAEELMAARDAMLAAETGARVHIAHVSTARTVDIIRKAKIAGAKITAETCPQYFSLTEDEILRQGSLARVNPPLRTAEDVAGIIRGLEDGTLDAIATDHAPHSAEEKSRPLPEAMSGMIGLETSLALALTFLYHAGHLSIYQIIRLMSLNPAQILSLEAKSLTQGAAADIVIFDPDEEWTVEPEDFKSKSRNTPFAGMKLRGRVKYTIVDGRIVYKGE